MNIKTTISAINKHLKETFDLFGGQSEEYARALNQVRDNLPNEVLQQIIADVENKKDLTRYKNTDEMWQDLGL